MEKNIAIGFIIFNPPLTFVDRLMLLFKIQDLTILVFDNSPEHLNSKKVAHLAETGNKLVYLTDGYNAGLLGGFQRFITTSRLLSLPFFMFFDPDTVFSERTIEFVRHQLRCIGLEQLSRVAGISFSGAAEPANLKTIRALQNGELIVNSGMLFVVANLNAIRWPNKLFFVECLDYHLCLMSKVKRYPILRIHNVPDFDHFQEQDVTFHTGSGKDVRPQRIYPLKRTREYILGSAILICMALGRREFHFARRFAFLLLVFIFVQLYLRVILALKKQLKGA
jgi:hypothetical protein